jgi:hypothetical protein
MFLAESATNHWVPHPPGFPVRLGGVNELHAAFPTESRTRGHGWGRAVGNTGSLNPYFGFKGGIHESRYTTSWFPPLFRGANHHAQ